MRIIDCQQRSEEWDRWRNRPTASGFGSFVTPVKAEYSKQATSYAATIVAKQLGVYSEAPPTWAMERGIELEPSAKLAYTAMTGRAIEEVGFIMPDDCSLYGGSPDGLVGTDALIEIKCPLAETLIGYHVKGDLPAIYKPQVQGLMLISGRPRVDFFGFHPELEPFLLPVEADYEYQTRIAECLLLLLEEIKQIKACVKRQEHPLAPSESQDDLKWEEGS